MIILDNMSKAIAASRSELSPYAPRVYKLTIDPSKIGALIGPGGKTIRSIIEEDEGDRRCGERWHGYYRLTKRGSSSKSNRV